MPLPAGTRLGSYEILAAIGAGGMGEVYQARDHRLGRTVAIKVVLEALAADGDSIARLRREAQALAALNHPHIATLHGLEEQAGRLPVSTAGGFVPFWSPSGRELYYADVQNDLQVVDLSFSAGRPVVSKPRKVVDVPDLASPRLFRLTPDGQRFLIVTRPASEENPTEIRVVLNWFEELKGKMARK